MNLMYFISEMWAFNNKGKGEIAMKGVEYISRRVKAGVYLYHQNKK